MKIAIAATGDISSFQLGWARAFEHAGHQVNIWSTQQKPAFDFFSEFEPGLLMVDTKNLTRAIVKNIASRPHMKVMLWASHWGSFDAEIDRVADGYLLATDAEKQAVQILTNLRPDIKHVFAPYIQGWAEVTHDRWRNFGLQPIGLPTAADPFVYSNGVFSKALESDVVFIGKYEQKYAQLLLPLCREMRCKFFGPDGWPVAQYLGTIHPHTTKNVLASAKVCANIYVTNYGFEIGERPFQILAAGAMCVSLPGLDSVFKEGQVAFCNPEDFHDTVRHYVAHPEEAIPFIERGLKAIADGHTYLHRLDAALPAIGV